MPNKSQQLQRAALALKSNPDFEIVRDYILDQMATALFQGSFDDAENNLRNYRAVAMLDMAIDNLAEGQ